METKTLGFIGGGRITRIILQAFTNRNVKFDSIIVFEPDVQTAANLREVFPTVEISRSVEAPARQDIIFLAIHPPVMMDTLNEISRFTGQNTTLVSLAPKITMDKIGEVVTSAKIIRMIPNATSYINRGYNPVCFHHSFMHKEKKLFKKIFRTLGKVIEVKEEKLEAWAIVSAMLPTYFWFQWKKMEDIAIKTGFSEDESKKIIRSTLKRAIRLYYNSGLTPEQVIDLIPVKPIGEHEEDIETILDNKLLGLYEKIKP